MLCNIVCLLILIALGRLADLVTAVTAELVVDYEAEIFVLDCNLSFLSCVRRVLKVTLRGLMRKEGSFKFCDLGNRRYTAR